MPVIAVGATDEGKTLLLAFTNADMLRLVEGEHIAIKLDQVFGGKVECFVFLGESEAAIKAELAANGSVTANLKSTDTVEDLEKMLAEDRTNNKH